MKTGAFFISVLLCSLGFNGLAFAHQLRVFAMAEGATITGYAYFSGGVKVKGAKVAIFAPDGSQLGEVKTDNAGAFRFPATVRVEHKLIADAGAGHVAEFTVAAEELPDTLPGKDANSLPEVSVVNAVTTEQVSPLPMTKTAVVSLQRMIERSVARQIRPLREQLEAYEAKVRWHDVLGGIGYILGIAGVACYWLGRRQLHSSSTSDRINGSTTESRE